MPPDVPRPRDYLTESDSWIPVGRGRPPLPATLEKPREQAFLLNARQVWEEIAVLLSATNQDSKQSIDHEAIQNRIATGSIEKDLKIFIGNLEKYCRQKDRFFTYDTEVVQRAFIVAALCHTGQKRKSGGPYMVHVCSVTFEFLELLRKAKETGDGPIELTETICKSLLHDTIEDAPEWLCSRSGKQEIQIAATAQHEAVSRVLGQRGVPEKSTPAESADHRDPPTPEKKIMCSILGVVFGEEVQKGTLQLTKFSKRRQFIETSAVLEEETKDLIDFVDLLQEILQSDQSQNSSRKDPERKKYDIIAIKIADRIHNMKTLSGFEDKTKRKAIAWKTLLWYAPLAALLGFREASYEIERLCLPHIFLPEDLEPYRQTWHLHEQEEKGKLALAKQSCGPDEEIVEKPSSFSHAFVAFLENMESTASGFNPNFISTYNLSQHFKGMLEEKDFPGRMFFKLSKKGERKSKATIQAGVDGRLEIKASQSKMESLQRTLTHYRQSLEQYPSIKWEVLIGDLLRDLRGATFGTPETRARLAANIPTYLRNGRTSKIK